MRFLIAALILLAACGPRPEQTAPSSTVPRQADHLWFICDAIDAPTLFVFERDGDTVRVAEYDKPNGAIVTRHEFIAGAEEGAAGSVYTSLLRDGADAGAVRALNPGMLETPGAAFTTPISSVRLDDRTVSCRWLPRTRLMGFTGRRTIVVHEDADGDLIYTSYDFANAASAAAIELSDNARTTAFSLEVRGGGETLNADGVVFQFQADSETEIIVTETRETGGAVEVRRHGPNPSQTEQLIAAQTGEAET
ncbi:hypothetical protein U91I_01317 [alpha proteobacterium U9-1i]|nr:hypothetical protein U91I_01317 [alpha proteobacterium U9-1i]